MANFKLMNYAGADGNARPAILTNGDDVIDLQEALNVPWTRSSLTMLDNWEAALPVLHQLAEIAAGTGRKLDTVRVLAPLLYPPAIFCVRSNYVEHAKEMSPEVGAKLADIDKSETRPYFFVKSGPHCVIGQGDEIRLPRISSMVDWEAEFAVVIGKRGRNIPADQAMDHVAGYTIMNDLSARDLRRRADWQGDVDWFAHKTFETSAPLGPWITPADNIPDPYQCRMRLWVNDEKMQDASISGLIFNVAELIGYLSQRVTLRPGDVIATGTPSGVGRARGIYLKPDDRVRIDVTGIGTLQNPVVQGD